MNEETTSNNVPDLVEGLEIIQSYTKKFWQSSIIRIGVVLVSIRIVDVVGKVVLEHMRRKNE